MLNFKKWINEAGGDNPMAEPPMQQLKGLTIKYGQAPIRSIPQEDDLITPPDTPPAKRKFGKNRFQMKKK
jgi:hypothetical protein